MLPATRTPLAFGALLTVLGLACQPLPPAELRVDAVRPASARAGLETQVQLVGSFEPAVFTDFANGGRSTLGDVFEVRLGDVALSSVHLEPDGTLSATVPATVPAGEHPLVVTTGDGRTATLAAPYPVFGAATRLLVGKPATPPAEDLPFELTIAAVDADGRTVSDFNAAVAIGVTPSGALTCHSGCEVAPSLRTTSFLGGTWTGTVSIREPATARFLTADGGGLTGVSEAFDVRMRTPPEVPWLKIPVAVFPGVGGDVMVDASLSQDRHTPTPQLQMSLGVGGDLTSPESPGVAPWTSYVAGAVLSKRADTTAFVRVAMKDSDGDVGYAPRHLLATVEPSELCAVTTSRPRDDGATDCFRDLGADQALSLPEAIRLTNARPGRQVITFSLDAIPANTEIVRTSSDADTFQITGPLWILAPTVAGEQLELAGWNWDIRSPDVVLAGFHLTFLGQGLQGTVTVAAGAELRLVHTTLRDFVGLRVAGRAVLEDVELRRCWAAQCILVSGDAASLSMSGGTLSAGTNLPFFDDGIFATSCGAGTLPVVDVSGVVFQGVPQQAIQQDTSCDRPVRVRNATFHEVGTGVAVTGATTNWITDSLFTGVGTPVSCGTAGFATGGRGRNLLFGYTSSGCLLGDPGNLYADPRYVSAADGSDLRLQRTSPARDAAADHGLDVNGVAPGLFLGAGPDLGGRETW